MTKNYMKTSVAFVMMTTSLGVYAQVTPKFPGEIPVTGKQYILFNKAQNSEQYMSRTSWDGALYFLGKSDSHYADHAITAVYNEDGTWSFSKTTTSDEEEVTLYMAIPAGTCNLNFKADEPAMWTLTEGEGIGYYHLTADKGNNSHTLGMKLHLNAGGQYFVISEQQDGGQWWPDIYGGAERWEDESIGEEYATPLDSISFNWAFVQVGNVDDYVQDMQVVNLINSMKDKSEIEGFEDGFLATYNATAKIYESESYDIDNDLELILAMINNKNALYAEIETATDLNETDDAILAAAIANAQNSFTTTTDAVQLESAITALKNAELAYSLGSGDITALGTNLSFEDLTSQGGNETSGIAGAPAGWNVYINGEQVVTEADVRAAGMSAWHGINADSSGDIKDGKLAFGIWNSGIPAYEISQTISGLDNGTYIITAGLMAGSNGSGSRLTTQRIFGNLNSAYYASEGDYATGELDQMEVYDFANNEIITTDTEMRPVSVRAYVYDGTLTFGLRTDGNYAANNRASGNGAGGDGWFKVDNFTIKKEGYIAEDAMRIIDHYRNTLDIFRYDCKMDPEVMETLVSQISKFEGINENSAQDDINKAIVDAKALVETVGVSVKAYQRLEEAINQHFEYLEQYENKAGAGEYADAIYEAQFAWDDCTIKTSEIDALIETLDAALQACIQSDEIVEDMDLTDYIKNPSFEDLSAQGGNNSGGVAAPPAGWSLILNGVQCKTAAETAANVSGWCAINNGDAIDVTNSYGDQVYTQYTDGDHLWGIWSSTVPEVELSQTISHLPAGTYTLTCDIVVQNDWAGANLATQRIFANDYVCMFGAEEDYIQNLDTDLFTTFPRDITAAKKIDEENADAAVKHLNYAGNYSSDNYGASGAPYTTSLTFGVAQAGDINFGFRTSRLSAADAEISSQASMGWFKIDNWTLHYDSKDVPEGAEATGIANVVTAGNTPVQFFSIAGARLAAPQKGINIIKIGNTIQKVLVK